MSCTKGSNFEIASRAVVTNCRTAAGVAQLARQRTKAVTTEPAEAVEITRMEITDHSVFRRERPA